MPGTILVSGTTATYLTEFKVDSYFHNNVSSFIPFSSGFNGLQSSSSTPPQFYIKVSMGKREFRTWDKEDFSFPLTTFRDNLIITLHDVEGNEISRTGIETRLVVEKGIWDDIFPLEGRGYVHLKLQFVLSEEERHRIRDMRESALRKKLVELSSGDVRSPENAMAVGSNAESPVCLSQEISDSHKSLLQSEVTTALAGLQSIRANDIKYLRVGTEEREETFSGSKETKPMDARRLEQPPLSRRFDVHLTEVINRSLVEKIETHTPHDDVPLRTIGSKEALSLLESSESVVAVKNKFTAPKLEEAGSNNTEEQRPVRRIPSNVRNMITAFESSLSQDVRPAMEPAPATSQLSKVATETSLKSSSSDESKVEKIKLTESMWGRIENPFCEGGSQQAIYTQKRGFQLGSVRAFYAATTSKVTGQFDPSAADVKTKKTTANLKSKLAGQEIEMKEWENASEDLMRASTGKTATISGRILDKHTGGQQLGKLLVNQHDSGKKLSIKQSAKGIHPELDYKRTSRQVQKPKESWKHEHYSFRCPGTWIFPVESRHLCITTGSKQIMDLIQNFHAKTDNNPGSKRCAPENVEKSSTHHGYIKVNDVEKSDKGQRKPKFENSADDGTSDGPVGQVMKVVIMIGFATLVFFTRQRNNS